MTQKLNGHGFRTMVRGALGESDLWSDDAIERQLSHSERNNVRAAYIHTSEHLDERRLMVQWWADYLDDIVKEYLSPFDFAKKHLRFDSAFRYFSYSMIIRSIY